MESQVGDGDNLYSKNNYTVSNTGRFRVMYPVSLSIVSSGWLLKNCMLNVSEFTGAGC